MRNLQQFLTEGYIVTLDYIEGGRHEYRDGYITKGAIKPLEYNSGKDNVNTVYTYVDNFDDNLIARNSTLTSSVGICAVYKNTDDWVHKRAYWRRMYDHVLLLARKVMTRDNARITTSCSRFESERIGVTFLDFIDSETAVGKISYDGIVIEDEDTTITVDVSKADRKITISY